MKPPVIPAQSAADYARARDWSVGDVLQSEDRRMFQIVDMGNSLVILRDIETNTSPFICHIAGHLSEMVPLFQAKDALERSANA